MGLSKRTLAVVGVLSLVVAACSSGPSAEDAAFCDDYVSVRGLVVNTPEDDAGLEAWVGDVTAGLEGLKADAPESISGAVNGMADALLEPIANVDEEAFFAAMTSSGFAEDSAVVDGFVVDECEFNSLDVTAIDYAYAADVENLEVGPVAFSFSNEGNEFHELALIRINDDTTESIQELLELPEEEAFAKTTFMGVSFAAPGEASTMYADLDEGRYVFICFIPVGSTSLEAAETAEGPPHFTQGMVTEFTIEG